MNFLEKATQICNKLFIFIAGLFLCLMVLLTCLNIVLRLFGQPLRGTVELMGFFGAVTATFALAYTQTKRDHISVTVLFDRMPSIIQKLSGSLNDLICMIFSLIGALQVCGIANAIFKAGEVTETLRISFYPFVYASAAGFFLLVIVFLLELIKVAIRGFKNDVSAFEKEFEAGDK